MGSHLLAAERVGYIRRILARRGSLPAKRIAELVGITHTYANKILDRNPEYFERGGHAGFGAVLWSLKTDATQDEHKTTAGDRLPAEGKQDGAGDRGGDGFDADVRGQNS